MSDPSSPGTAAGSMSDTPSSPHAQTDRRARPRLSEQIQVIRELWLLREQARVQAAERCFLVELEAILSGRLPHTPIHGLSDAPLPPHAHSTAASRLVRSHVPEPPPLPGRFARGASHTSYSAATFLEDGPVYESNPPPRDATSAPARERPELILEEVEELRSQQRVTNLSPEFRAILEGNGPSPNHRSLVRSRSFGELSDQRAVSNALESEFRHHLEGVLVRRGASLPASQLRHLYRSGSYAPHRTHETPPDELERRLQDAAYGTPPAPASHALEAVVRALREEVTVLKNVISASFDLQLDIQRSIRQEVAAAISSPVKLSMQRQDLQETSLCTTEPASSATHGMDDSPSDLPLAPRSDARPGAQPVAAGTCTVCLEAHIDSLLYGCGHMCTCSLCGRQLIATGQPCPICRAPVRDVVRAFMVTEQG